MSTDLQITSSRDVRRQVVRVSYDEPFDFLTAAVPNVVIDGLLADEVDEPLDGLYVFHRGPDGPVVGFGVDDAFAWDVIGNEEDVVWNDAELRFDVPTLGLRDASIGAIVLAAQGTIQGSTPDVEMFRAAVHESAEDNWGEAEELWRQCLAGGEMKAHYGLGYTLLELGRPHDAFGHFVTYTELTPRLAWGWRYRGLAAAGMGDVDEARKCYERAIECEDEGSDETDADELLAELDD